MAVHADDFTHDQEDYFDTLCTLMEAWDRAQVKWPKPGGLALLRHLVDSNGLTGAELSRILGGSRQLGPMILRAERAITASHARKLGAHFKLDPGAFIR
ncbi:MAG: type II toxin-antitoxin system HigA family antitoxin [Verrucomicrobiales bacterium]